MQSTRRCLLLLPYMQAKLSHLSLVQPKDRTIILYTCAACASVLVQSCQASSGLAAKARSSSAALPNGPRRVLWPSRSAGALPSLVCSRHMGPVALLSPSSRAARSRDSVPRQHRSEPNSASWRDFHTRTAYKKPLYSLRPHLFHLLAAAAFFVLAAASSRSSSSGRRRRFDRPPSLRFEQPVAGILDVLTNLPSASPCILVLSVLR
jgi:hypothetical protein